MKNRVLYIVILIAVVSCMSAKVVLDNFSFLKQLYSIQKSKKGCSYYPEVSYKQRLKLKDKFGFINYDADTVYLLESSHAETGTLYEALWTKKGKIEYKGQGDVVELGSDYFIERLYPMIENWDIATIRKEEKEHGGMLDGGDLVGARIIINNGKLQMKCITFKEFFDIRKDRKN